ncbi:MAG: alpha/beta hydrolase [Chloroflexota bacterium]
MHYYASEADNYLRPPVLLIHGAGGHHLYWPAQVRRLGDQRVFAMDLPGHGRSDGIGHHRVQDYVEDLLQFMNQLRLNAAVMVGHSMGGAIALDAALRYPQRVLGLGLVGSGARLRLHPDILSNASQEATFPAAVRLIGERSFAARTGGRLRELALRRMAEMRPAVLEGDLLACDAFDVMGQLVKIACPTLILCGAEDEMTPRKFSEYLHENIRGSTLRIIPNAGHMVMLEEPNAVADVLGSFLDSIPYEPGR